MIEGCNATSDHDTAKLTTTVWHNRGDAALWQVICDFRVMRTRYTSPIAPHRGGEDKGIGRAFLISPAPHGLDRKRLRQRYKMARQKQCQKLGGSCNADLTEPQGVTPV